MALQHNTKACVVQVYLTHINNKCFGLFCFAVYPLTSEGVCEFFVTPDEVLEQTPVGLDQFTPLRLSCQQLPILPTFCNRQLALCILNLAIQEQVERMFQTDLEDIKFKMPTHRETQDQTVLQHRGKQSRDVYTVQSGLLSYIPLGNASLLNVSSVHRCCYSLPSLS